MPVTVERGPDRVVCRGRRHWLRVRRAAEGLHVAAATPVTPRWQRVDHDVVLLVRAATRLRLSAPDAAGVLALAAAGLAGIEPRDPGPVTGLVRAAFPLLATPSPWPLAGLPAALPADLQPAFRRARLRDAARSLFDDRATRPVVRGLGALLLNGERPDLFTLTVAMAAAGTLAPEHVAAILAARGADGTDDRPLGAAQRDTLARLVARVPPRRAVGRLVEAVVDPGARARARFVADARDVAPPDGLRLGWDDLALHVALAPSPV